MSRPHVIEHVELAFSFTDEETAMTTQSQLEDTFKHAALKVIDEVFERLAPPREVLRIDVLQIDAPTRLHPFGLNDWVHRLRAAIAEAVERAKAEAASLPSASAHALPLDTASLQALLDFVDK